MLWTSLSLPRADEILSVLKSWVSALKTDGLLLFIHFDHDNLTELTGRLRDTGIACETLTLIDIHDFDDILADNGFYGPAIDTARLELSYHEAATFRQNMETLGLWNALKLNDIQTVNAFVDEIFEAGGHLSIMLETVYGHTAKKLVLPQGENIVRFPPKGQGQNTNR